MITYPPEMLPRADADDEAEVIVQELEDLRAENERLRTALNRICGIAIKEPPPMTDPDWIARLMQGIAREALTPQKPSGAV